MTKARFKDSAESLISKAVGTTEVGEVISSSTTEIEEGVFEDYICIIFYEYGAEVSTVKSDCEVWEEE